MVLGSIWLQARQDTAPEFRGLEIVKAVPYRRRRRLALQTIEHRVRLSEPVLRIVGQSMD
jgi:hypothetical protein